MTNESTKGGFGLFTGATGGMETLKRSVTEKVDIQINSGMFTLKYNEVIQDKYILKEKLGEGSYGVAVRAIHKESKDIRAIKTLA
ncbi:MAG: hypothetical protein V2I33_19160, partial [Kangiellaceae bacterium]|nr:hypothetical protein [Kangiellaceae bacterium]